MLVGHLPIQELGEQSIRVLSELLGLFQQENHPEDRSDHVRSALLRLFGRHKLVVLLELLVEELNQLVEFGQHLERCFLSEAC